MYKIKEITRSPEQNVNVGGGLNINITSRYDVIIEPEGAREILVDPLQLYQYMVSMGLPIPKHGDPYRSPDGFGVLFTSTVQSFTASRAHNNKTHFVYTFTYGPSPQGRMFDPTTGRQPGNRDNNSSEDDPTKLMPQWSITFEERRIPLWLGNPRDFDGIMWPDNWIAYSDYDGIRFINSAGDHYDPMPDKVDKILVLNYSDYRQVLDVGLAYKYKDTINLHPFLFKFTDDILNYDLIDTLTGKKLVDDKLLWHVADVRITPEVIGAVTYYKYDFVLKFSKIGWWVYELDAGLYQLKKPGNRIPPTRPDNYDGDFSPENRQPIPSLMTGLPVNRPVPLNGGGQPSYGRAYYRRFRTKFRSDFSKLGIRLLDGKKLIKELFI